MLSRHNSERAQRLRHARSSRSNASKTSNSDLGERNAPSFDQAGAIAAAERAYNAAGLGQQSPQTLKAKSQSVRYVGPNANSPLVQRSITRRQARALDAASVDGKRNAIQSEAGFDSTPTLLTALPPWQSPTQHNAPNKLRKVRSSHSARSLLGRSYIGQSQTSVQCSSVDLLSGGGSTPSIPAFPTPQDVSNFGRHSSSSLKVKDRLNNENRRSKRGTFSLKATVRSHDQVTRSDMPNVCASSRQTSTVKRRASSFKKGLQNIFHLRTPSRKLALELPTQQVEASRLHFSDFSDEAQMPTDTSCPNEGRALVAPSEEPKCGTSGDDNDAVQEQLDALSAIVRGFRDPSCSSWRALRSQGNTDTDASRVTSWADSSMTEWAPHMDQGTVKKRLTTIEEYGDSYQPSSSRVRSQFRDRIDRTISGRTAEPVPAQRVFSALRKHLGETSADHNHSGNQPNHDSASREDLGLPDYCKGRRDGSKYRIMRGSAHFGTQMPSAVGSLRSLRGKVSNTQDWTDDETDPMERPGSTQPSQFPRNISEASLAQESKTGSIQKAGISARHKSKYTQSADKTGDERILPDLSSSYVRAIRSRFIGLGSESASLSKETVDSASMYSRAADGTPKSMRLDDHVGDNTPPPVNIQSVVIGKRRTRIGPAPPIEDLRSYLKRSGGMAHWAQASISEFDSVDFGHSWSAERMEVGRNPFGTPAGIRHVREHADVHGDGAGSSNKAGEEGEKPTATLTSIRTGSGRLSRSCSPVSSKCFLHQQHSETSHVYPFINVAKEALSGSQDPLPNSHTDASQEGQLAAGRTLSIRGNENYHRHDESHTGPSDTRPPVLDRSLSQPKSSVTPAPSSIRGDRHSPIRVERLRRAHGGRNPRGVDHDLTYEQQDRGLDAPPASLQLFSPPPQPPPPPPPPPLPSSSSLSSSSKRDAGVWGPTRERSGLFSPELANPWAASKASARSEENSRGQQGGGDGGGGGGAARGPKTRGIVVPKGLFQQHQRQRQRQQHDGVAAASAGSSVGEDEALRERVSPNAGPVFL